LPGDHCLFQGCALSDLLHGAQEEVRQFLSSRRLSELV
jgi:hypothetical protein